MYWQHYPTFVSAGGHNICKSAGHLLRDGRGDSIVAIFSGEWHQPAADAFQRTLSDSTFDSSRTGMAFAASVTAIAQQYGNLTRDESLEWGFATFVDGGAVYFSCLGASAYWLGHTKIYVVRDGKVIHSSVPQTILNEAMKQKVPRSFDANLVNAQYHRILVRHFPGGGPHDEENWQTVAGDRVIICSHNVEESTVLDTVMTQCHLPLSALAQRLSEEMRSRRPHMSATLCLSECLHE